MEIINNWRDLTLLFLFFFFFLLLQLSPAELPRPFPTGRWWARISAGAPVSATPASRATSCPCPPCSPARATAPGAGRSPSASVSHSFLLFHHQSAGFRSKSSLWGLFVTFFFSPRLCVTGLAAQGSCCASCSVPKGSLLSAGVGILGAVGMVQEAGTKVWLLSHLPHALVFLGGLVWHQGHWWSPQGC